VPLADVKKAIEERVASIEAEKLAQAAGEKRLAELKAGGSAEFGASKPVSRANFNGVSAPAVTAIMKADPTKLPAYVGVSVPGKGYSIFRINSIDEQTANAEAIKSEKQQVEEFIAAQEMAGYLGVIRKRAKAEILKTTPEPKAVTASKQ
jgi:peptidyl-prolyl cis-trans isomerase D